MISADVAAAPQNFSQNLENEIGEVQSLLFDSLKPCTNAKI